MDNALSAQDLRLACRQGRFSGHTPGQAPGRQQANLVVLPADWAAEFLRFCLLNPKPCPVLGVSEPGAIGVPNLAPDLDLRRDLPRYRVWRGGALAGEPTDVAYLWRDDLVAVALGCSFGFEAALRAAGLTPRHVAMGRNAPMFRTNIECAAAGRFGGPLVVSMRPYAPADAIQAVQITAHFPEAHGAPVHIGFPERIGIADLGAPNFGDAVPVHPGELPLFWA